MINETIVLTKENNDVLWFVSWKFGRTKLGRSGSGDRITAGSMLYEAKRDLLIEMMDTFIERCERALKTGSAEQVQELNGIKKGMNRYRKANLLRLCKFMVSHRKNFRMVIPEKPTAESPTAKQAQDSVLFGALVGYCQDQLHEQN